jgi:hypothetical protein
VGPIRRTPQTDTRTGNAQRHPHSPLATSRLAFLVLSLGCSVPPTNLPRRHTVIQTEDRRSRPRHDPRLPVLSRLEAFRGTPTIRSADPSS